jgi:hypothetical protein
MEQSKTCKKCQQIKTLDKFPIHKECLDGHSNVCKQCKVNQERIRRAKNPEFYKAKAAATRKANHEKRMQYQREWRAKNPELYRESARRLYWQNPEVFRLRRKRYSERNPEIDRKHARARKAKRKAVVHESYTTELILKLYGSDCYLCGEPIDLNAPRWTAKDGWEKGLHLDHVIPLSKNGPDTPENVRPTHGICNIKKQAN